MTALPGPLFVEARPDDGQKSGLCETVSTEAPVAQLTSGHIFTRALQAKASVIAEGGRLGTCLWTSTPTVHVLENNNITFNHLPSTAHVWSASSQLHVTITN